MADELSNVGSPVTYEQLEERILSTLPPSFAAARAAWETLPCDDQRNINRLTARMVLEETRNKSVKSGGENTADAAFFASHPSRILKKQVEEGVDGAFAAHSGYRGRGYRGRGRADFGDRRGFELRNGYGRGRAEFGDRRGFELRDGYGRGRDRGNHYGSKPAFGPNDCYRCGNPGHLARNCYSRMLEDRRNARQDRYVNNRNLNDGNGERLPATNLMSSFCFIGKNEDDWYADSGATHHMTEMKHFFASFESVKPGSWYVHGIGGVKLQVMGVGDIEIETV